MSAGERGKGFEGEDTEGKDKRVGTRGGGSQQSAWLMGSGGEQAGAKDKQRRWLTAQ